MTDQPSLAQQLDALSDKALLSAINQTLARRQVPPTPAEAEAAAAEFQAAADDAWYESIYPPQEVRRRP